jgi:hypothetical protein
MAQPPTPLLPTKKFRCFACGNIMEVPQGMPKPAVCSKCGAPAPMIHRIDKGPPGGRGAGRHGAGGGRWLQQA